MPFRKIIFWSHLVAGVTAGLFILLMSVTGVILTYEKNLVNMVRNSATVTMSEGRAPLSIDQLTEIAHDMGRQGASLAFGKNPNAPILIQQRGHEPILLNPYTGEAIDDPSQSLDGFFGTVTSLHRWLAMSGDNRKTGRAITGAANLTFLFIVISGLYLWLPKMWRWSFIKLNLLFRRNLPNAKARDYNWHHVLGIWALIPLFFIVISGVVISYSWAGNLVYKVAGEDPPQRRGPPNGNRDAKLTPETMPIILSASLQNAYDIVKTQAREDWSSARIGVPRDPQDRKVSITLNFGKGVVPNYRETYTFDRHLGEVTETETSQDMSRGRKMRVWLRFIHTGEQYGFIGQTIAGLSTLAACFLVYTGLALSYRRLITPLFRSRKKKKKSRVRKS